MKLARFVTFCCAALLIAGGALAQEKEKKPKKKGKGRAVLEIPEVEKKDIICFALYTISDNVLKLTAQLYPIAGGDTKIVRLEIEKGGKWVEVAKTEVIELGWTAPFRVEKWDDTKTQKYRVLHGAEATYEGSIRKNPIDKDEIV
ncbi:hypothetical protein OAL00_04680, partial [Verrucomicrobiales bacterium]|nr:hypothetical protein [Verrucomicrobiales bacterium]